MLISFAPTVMLFKLLLNTALMLLPSALAAVAVSIMDNLSFFAPTSACKKLVALFNPIKRNALPKAELAALAAKNNTPSCDKTGNCSVTDCSAFAIPPNVEAVACTTGNKARPNSIAAAEISALACFILPSVVSNAAPASFCIAPKV